MHDWLRHGRNKSIINYTLERKKTYYFFNPLNSLPRPTHFFALELAPRTIPTPTKISHSFRPKPTWFPPKIVPTKPTKLGFLGNHVENIQLIQCIKIYKLGALITSAYEI